MRILLYGGTGQSKVVRTILSDAGHEIVAVFDKNPNIINTFDCVLIHDENDIAIQNFDAFVVCVGGCKGAERVRISRSLTELGAMPIDAIHHTSFIAASVHHGRGIQVMARAVVSEDVRIGDFCILNTNCTIDHECQLGDGVHVMGGASIAGCAVIENYASIGTNATLLPRVRIGESAVIGAGAVVVRDVEPGVVVVGVPARPLRSLPRQKFEV